MNHIKESQYPTLLPHTCLPTVLWAYSFANNSFGYPIIGTVNIQFHLPTRQFNFARIMYIRTGRWLGSLMYNKSKAQNNTCDRRPHSLKPTALSPDKMPSPREGVKIPTLTRTICPELDGQKMNFFILGSVVSTCTVDGTTWTYPVLVGQAFLDLQ